MQADAFVALDGSLGTVTEFFLVWNHIFLDRSHGPLVCLGESWRERLRVLGGSGFGIGSDVRALVRVAADPAEAVRMLEEAAGAAIKAEGAGG
jgi:predicted Rossmann-fold nucleotide-binding protein